MKTLDDVLNWVSGIVNQKYPSYVIKLLPTTEYVKVSLMSAYADDCIFRVHNYGVKKWFSFHSYPGINRKDPRFDAVENKNKNHWKIEMDKLDDLLKYEDQIIPIVEYFAKTVEIDKNPYDPEVDSIISALGSGIVLHI